jgi:DNA-binding transcriptional MerR regulator
MAEDLLTIKEIAKRLDVPESNLRYYRDRFEDFLPSLGEGRKRRYKPEALDVFRFIVQGYKNDLNTEQITHRLMTRFPRNLEPAESKDPEHFPAPAASETQSLSSFQDFLLQSQARTLEHVTQALLQKGAFERQYAELSREQAKIKKGLFRIWSRVKQSQGHPGRPQETASEETHVGSSGLDQLQQRILELENRQKELEDRFESHAREMTDLLERCFSGLERLLEHYEGQDPDDEPGHLHSSDS